MAGGVVPHSWCWECSRAYFRAAHLKRKPANNLRSANWQIVNREKAKAAARKWKAANGDAVRAYQKRQYEANAEVHRERTKVWQKTNPDKVAAQNRLRRARRQGAVGTHTLDDVADLLRKQRSRCVYCAQSLKNGYHVDHILPLSRGGSNDKRNLQLTCAKCNLTKGSRDPIAHARIVGLLL